MVPKDTTGRSFKGASAYLLHDKKAGTSERVAWTHSENLRSERAEWAWREMAWTAQNADAIKAEHGISSAGRKAEKPVYHLSLSWAKEEAPSKEEMIAAGKEALASIGMEEHQALFVCHNDEPQPHIHLLVNRVDPESGKLHTLSRNHRKLSAWALKYEHAQGKIRCKKRVANNRDLQQGNKPRHKKQSVIAIAWERSDSGKAFQSALAEHGYVLANGNSRIVVVDPHGKVINPARYIYDKEARKALKESLAEIKQNLPDAEKVPARIAAKADKAGTVKKDSRKKKSDAAGNDNRRDRKRDAAGEHYDREEELAAQQTGELDAADREAQRKAEIEEQKAREARRQQKVEREKTVARIRILKEGTKARAQLKEQQGAEAQRLEKLLREKDSPDEAAHRARWQGMIDGEQERIAKLNKNLAQKGMRGKIYRLLHGKEARQEIIAREKNIENEKMRLEEGVGGLTRADVQRLKEQRRTHGKQREALENDIDRQLEALEQGPGAGEQKSGAKRKKTPSYHVERFSRAAANEQDNRPAREAGSRDEEQDYGIGSAISRDHE